MATIRKVILEKLEGNGLFEKDANAIMEMVESAEENQSMVGRWDNDTQDYPPAILSLAWISAKKKAVEWMDENCPQHFARSLFA